MSLLSGGRFTLGLGAGENLNEHVTGGGWPPVNIRHAMLDEAVEIISSLFDGGYVNFQGTYFQVDSAKLWDLPDVRTPSASLSRETVVRIGRSPRRRHDRRRARWHAGFDVRRGRGYGKPRVGQVPVCFDTDREAAVERAHRLFKWFGGGWKVNAELPGTKAFDEASRFVRPDDVAASIPCGSDVDEFVAAVRTFTDAGFSHVALVQIGGDHQVAFIEWAEKELLPALRA